MVNQLLCPFHGSAACLLLLSTVKGNRFRFRFLCSPFFIYFYYYSCVRSFVYLIALSLFFVCLILLSCSFAFFLLNSLDRSTLHDVNIMQDIHNPKTLDQWGSNGSKIETNGIMEFDCFEFCTHRGHLLQMSIWFLLIARSHI